MCISSHCTLWGRRLEDNLKRLAPRSEEQCYVVAEWQQGLLAMPAQGVCLAAFEVGPVATGEGGCVCAALLCTLEHSFGPCCTLSLGSGLATCLRLDLLLCLPFQAMDLGVFGLDCLGVVLGCLVRGGSQQASGAF